MSYPPFNLQDYHHIITQALAEDIGRGDITAKLTIDEDQQAEFVIANRTPLVTCGLELALAAFTHIDPKLTLQAHCRDGEQLEAGMQLISGRGNARAILAAERTALNILQHLSGIATLTRQYVEQIKGTSATVLDTRKTLPGLRDLQKYAVMTGGGHNHRLRLDDGILIKDNHISVCGSISEAVRRARTGAPLLTAIEVECDTLEQVKEAMAAKADVIMLDNMSLEELRQAVALVNGRIPLEASGNVSLQTIRAIAETGVDFISIGKLTHSAPSCDIGLDIVMR